MSKKSIQQIRAELDELNSRIQKTNHISDNVLIANGRNKGKKRPEHGEKLKGRSNPETSKRMKGEGNHMFGKVHPNKGKIMPQISEKTKGKRKPVGFGEKISELKKGVPNLKLKGKKRPEHSIAMSDPKRNKGAEVLRQPWKCLHCKKEGVGLTNFVRWHGDNCKHK